VVPTMPRAWLQQGLVAPFTDYTLPALALGILCGDGALLAFVTVLRWPRAGGVVSVVAGILMVGFELVEILVVGFTPVWQGQWGGRQVHRSRLWRPSRRKAKRRLFA
jgi:hypothetical protein